MRRPRAARDRTVDRPVGPVARQHHPFARAVPGRRADAESSTNTAASRRSTPAPPRISVSTTSRVEQPGRRVRSRGAAQPPAAAAVGHRHDACCRYCSDINDGVIVVDNNGHVLEINPAARTILGLGPRMQPDAEWEQTFCCIDEHGNNYPQLQRTCRWYARATVKSLRTRWPSTACPDSPTPCSASTARACSTAITN